jgi:hypothetical protein
MVLILFAMAVLSVWRLPPLHPAQLWSIPWALAAGLYFMHLLPYRRLDVETVVIACGSCLVFVLGTLAGERIGGRLAAKPDRRSNIGIVEIRWAATMAVGLTALMLCAFMTQAAAHFGVRAVLASTPNVRDAIGAGEFALTIKYVYAALAATALCAIAAAKDSKSRPTHWHAATILSILSIYFATGRSTLVVAVVVALVAYLLARERPLSRARFVGGSVAVGALALVVFIAGGKLIGKTFANNPGLQAVPSAFTQHARLRVLALPYEYASAPIAALDLQVDAASTWGTTHGCAAFSESCRVLERLGVSDVHAVPRVRPFTREPLPWNTYTALDIPLMDGGIAFVIPLTGLVGCALGGLWSVGRRRSTLGLCAYALLAPAAVTASGSFNFTAPHLLGAILISFVAFAGAQLLRRTRQNPTAALGEA